jgi:hypothetical protein
MMSYTDFAKDFFISYILYDVMVHAYKYARKRSMTFVGGLLRNLEVFNSIMFRFRTPNFTQVEQ